VKTKYDYISYNTSVSGGQEVVRFGGAQIAVTHDVDTNIETIKRAIDWAEENKVEYLVTPEGALSGYYDTVLTDDENWLKIEQGEIEVVAYAAEKNVGLCLGTFWREKERAGTLNRNQTRFYDWNGEFKGAYNKIRCIEGDPVVPGADNAQNGGDHQIIMLSVKANPVATFAVGVLICNDFYGEDPTGTTLARRALYSLKNQNPPVELVLHPTFGLRGKEVSDELDEEIMQVYDTWHESHVKQLSYSAMINVLTVDSITDFTGEVPPHQTSSPGGVIAMGKTIKKVPRTGEQYFYWDYRASIIGGSMSDDTFEPNVLEHLLNQNPAPVEE